MAVAAGIYIHLWKPEELKISVAKELIEPLTSGLVRLQADPDDFKKYNPENGWGDYEAFTAFVSEYLEACKAYPDARVEVWR